MTLAVQDLLRSFDALSDPERRVAVAEVLARMRDIEQPMLTDDELVGIAEDAFLRMEREEDLHE